MKDIDKAIQSLKFKMLTGLITGIDENFNKKYKSYAKASSYNLEYRDEHRLVFYNFMIDNEKQITDEVLKQVQDIKDCLLI